MNKHFLRAGAFLAAASMASLPAISQAATATSTQPVQVKYDTKIGPIMGFAVPWTGALQLTINPDGIIQGYYRPADNNAFVPVTGGRNGDSVWLDIGTMGHMHVSGTFKDGAITGAAIDETTSREYSFDATVSR